MIRVLRLAAIEVGKVEGGYRLHKALLVKKRLAGQMYVSGGTAGMLLFGVVLSMVKPTADETKGEIGSTKMGNCALI